MPMNRVLIVATLTALLVGCGMRYQAQLNGLVGKSYTEVLAALDEPYSGMYTAETPGETEIWVYLRDRTFTTNPSAVTTFSGNTAYTRFYGGGTSSLRCRTRIYVRDGVMVGYDLEGNDCIGPR